MAGFLYFIPDVNGVDDATLKRVGLEHLLGAPRRFGRMDRGPAGGPGCLVDLATGPDAPALAWVADAQQWPECPNAGFRIGFTKGAAPGPRDLQRADLIDGYPVTLADGNEWIVPLARVFATGRAVECRMRLGEGGRWVAAEAVERLVGVEAVASGIWAGLEAQFQLNAELAAASKPLNPVTISIDVDAAISGLAVNYRIGKFEVSALGLFTPSIVKDVLLALVDWPTISAAAGALEKKKPDSAAPDTP
jgi:hypothetical protein